MERLRVVVEGFHRLGLKRVEWKEYYLLKSVGESQWGKRTKGQKTPPVGIY